MIFNTCLSTLPLWGLDKGKKKLTALPKNLTQYGQKTSRGTFLVFFFYTATAIFEL